MIYSLNLDSFINEPEPLTESESEESSEEKYALFPAVHKDSQIPDSVISNDFVRLTKTLTPTELSNHIEEVILLIIFWTLLFLESKTSTI